MRYASAILAAAVTISTVLPAHSINRYTIASMSCASVQSAVRNDGAAILRHASAKIPGMTLYDRYVRNSDFCNPHEAAETVFVAARDDSTCAVRICVPRGGEFPFIPQDRDQPNDADGAGG